MILVWEAWLHNFRMRQQHRAKTEDELGLVKAAICKILHLIQRFWAGSLDLTSNRLFNTTSVGARAKRNGNQQLADKLKFKHLIKSEKQIYKSSIMFLYTY